MKMFAISVGVRAREYTLNSSMTPGKLFAPLRSAPIRTGNRVPNGTLARLNATVRPATASYVVTKQAGGAEAPDKGARSADGGEARSMLEA